MGAVVGCFMFLSILIILTIIVEGIGGLINWLRD